MTKIYMIESSNNTKAFNKGSKARGLGQITPIALKDWNQRNPDEQYTEKDLFDPAINKKIADWTMNARIPQMLQSYGIDDNIENRLIAYNWGAFAYSEHLKWIDGDKSVKKKFRKMPKETSDYIKKYNR